MTTTCTHCGIEIKMFFDEEGNSGIGTPQDGKEYYCFKHWNPETRPEKITITASDGRLWPPGTVVPTAMLHIKECGLGIKEVLDTLPDDKMHFLNNGQGKIGTEHDTIHNSPKTLKVNSTGVEIAALQISKGVEDFIRVSSDGKLDKFNNALCREVANDFDKTETKEMYQCIAKLITLILDECGDQFTAFEKKNGGVIIGDSIRKFSKNS